MKGFETAGAYEPAHAFRSAGEVHGGEFGVDPVLAAAAAVVFEDGFDHPTQLLSGKPGGGGRAAQ